MGENLIEDRVAGYKSGYTKRLDAISKALKFGEKYDMLSKSQQSLVEKQYKIAHPNEIVQPENAHDDAKLQELIKPIPIKGSRKKPSKPTPPKKTNQEIYILSESSKPRKFKHIPYELEKEIEDLLEENIEILEKDSFIIGRQVRTDDGKLIDLLALDKNGDTIIIELKKGETPRDVYAQIMEYFDWVERQKQEQLQKISKKRHLGKFHSLEQKFLHHFSNLPNNWNTNQKLIIVGEQIDKKTKEIASKLLKHNFDIKCIELNAFDNGHERIVNVRNVPLDN